MENVENILEKLFEHFKVGNAAELSEKINTSQKTISNWKVRNSISAVKKKCRELNIFDEIFGGGKIETTSSQLDCSIEKLLDEGISNYFTALKAVAIATNKEEELLEDIKQLMKKYIG